MADTTTSLLGLTKPAVGVTDTTKDWAQKWNDDFDLIDSKWTPTTPITQGFGDVADPGSSLNVARADHKHGMPSAVTAFKNILVNGGFEVCQRTAPFTSPANNVFTLDKWQIKQGGATPATFTVNVEVGASNVDGAPSVQSLKLDCTNIGVTLTDGLYISQKIENYKEYRGKQIALTVRVKTTLGSSKVKARIKDSVGNTVSNAHSGGGAFETLTVVRTVDATATSLLLEVGMLATTDVTVATLYIDNAMLVLNSSGVAFAPLQIGEELERCTRYYQTIQAYLVGEGGSDGTNYILGQSVAITPMPSTATVTTSTKNYVYEDGAVVDQKANYTLTTTLTNYGGAGPQDWTTLNVQVTKVVAGSRPAQASLSLALEDL